MQRRAIPAIQTKEALTFGSASANLRFAGGLVSLCFWKKIGVLSMGETEKTEKVEETLLFKNINALCDERKISVSQMLKDLNLPLSTVSNWSAERRWMTCLPLVAKYLDVSIDRLFSCADGQLTKYDRLKELVDCLNLTDDDVEFVCDMAKLVFRRYR